MIYLTKEFSMEMAHALEGYDGKCKNIHGHSYKLLVTIKGVPLQDDKSPKNGMLIDFGDLKNIIECQIVNIYDHSLVLHHKSPMAAALRSCDTALHLFQVQPTCENLAIHFADVLRSAFDAFSRNIKLHSVKLYETTTSYCEHVIAD